MLVLGWVGGAAVDSDKAKNGEEDPSPAPAWCGVWLWRRAAPRGHDGWVSYYIQVGVRLAGALQGALPRAPEKPFAIIQNALAVLAKLSKDFCFEATHS